MRKCPYCCADIKNSPHIYNCAKKMNIIKNNEEIKFDYIQYNFPEISKMNVLSLFYMEKKYSLPMLKTEFNIDFKSILFLLDYHKIKKRTSSESSLLISVSKQKKTLNKMYGVDNVSQIDFVKKKKKKTSIKNYGVDNIWKHPDYIDIIEQSIIEKYGITRKELLSINSKKIWESKTIEEKDKWLKNSIHSDNAIKKNGCNSISKLEKNVANLLIELSIPFETQFYIKTGKRKWKLYDFKIKNTNLIIEVNGDYWHANPKIYKNLDKIKYFYGDRIAEDIWGKDEVKKNIAESHGYIVKYIWENDIKNMSKSELLTYLKKLINENT